MNSLFRVRTGEYTENIKCTGSKYFAPNDFEKRLADFARETTARFFERQNAIRRAEWKTKQRKWVQLNIYRRQFPLLHNIMQSAINISRRVVSSEVGMQGRADWKLTLICCQLLRELDAQLIGLDRKTTTHTNFQVTSLWKEVVRKTWFEEKKLQKGFEREF